MDCYLTIFCRHVSNRAFHSALHYSWTCLMHSMICVFLFTDCVSPFSSHTFSCSTLSTCTLVTAFLIRSSFDFYATYQMLIRLILLIFYLYIVWTLSSFWWFFHISSLFITRFFWHHSFVNNCQLLRLVSSFCFSH